MDLRSTHKLSKIAIALSVAALIGVSAVLGTAAEGKRTAISKLSGDDKSVISVLDHGAAPGDGEDDTKAFQAALDAAASSKGTVVVPRGNYTFKGTLTVPAGVTLRGADDLATPKTGLPRLDVQCTKGDEKAAFLTLNKGAALDGIQFNYPQQSSSLPNSYGWTVRLSGADIRVSNVFCKNAWQFIDIGSVSSPNHVVEHCNIWAYKTGVYVDKCAGSGLLKDVHVWPFDGSTSEWVRQKATGFLFGYAKDETVDGCFTIRYNVGFHFKDCGNGVGNYTLQTTGADCGPTGLLVDNVKTLRVTSGQFMHKAEIKSTNTGTVEFIACNFRKWSEQSVEWQLKVGGGTVKVDSCIFGNWDSKGTGAGAILAEGGKLTVIACDFMEAKTAVELTGKVKSAAVTECLMKGSVNIKNSAGISLTDEYNTTY